MSPAGIAYLRQQVDALDEIGGVGANLRDLRAAFLRITGREADDEVMGVGGYGERRKALFLACGHAAQKVAAVMP